MSIIDNLQVIMWLHGDCSFLYDIYKRITLKTKKDLEDTWGRMITKPYRPDLTLNGQWTMCFGELIVKETLNATIPIKIGNCKLDLETHDYLIEVKTGTHNTTGTAHEKIMGVPFKYAEIPEKSGKKLLIICLGGAETYAKSVGLFGSESKRKNATIDIWRENGISFVPFTKIMKNEIN